jgi:alkyl sulfatase BDS1-like metallo-beta-lactamase superfamily hydrolase
MYGDLLPKNPAGNVGVGLGLTTAAGTITLFEPSKLIEKTGEQLTVDGIDVVFQMVLGDRSAGGDEVLFSAVQSD